MCVESSPMQSADQLAQTVATLVAKLDRSIYETHEERLGFEFVDFYSQQALAWRLQRRILDRSG